MSPAQLRFLVMMRISRLTSDNIIIGRRIKIIWGDTLFKFNGFTPKANAAINCSIDEASALGHTYIGSEHLLLALTSEKDSVAAKLLEARGVGFDNTRDAICRRVGAGERTRITPRDMTPRTKRIIENAAIQSSRFGQTYIGTEHLLLAIAAESDSIAVVILDELGVSAADIANDV